MRNSVKLWNRLHFYFYTRCKALFTRSVEKFVDRAYFCFFNKILSIKNFQRSSETNALRTKFFTLHVNSKWLTAEQMKLMAECSDQAFVFSKSKVQVRFLTTFFCQAVDFGAIALTDSKSASNNCTATHSMNSNSLLVRICY